MAIDFSLTSYQHELQLESRKFAADVLANARAAELLPLQRSGFVRPSPPTRPWWRQDFCGSAFQFWRAATTVA
jgi:hypothetical protein